MEVLNDIWEDINLIDNDNAQLVELFDAITNELIIFVIVNNDPNDNYQAPKDIWSFYGIEAYNFDKAGSIDDDSYHQPILDNIEDGLNKDV